MPQNEYISPAEYATYGLAPATTAAVVKQASSLVDAYLQRPEGLLYQADASGAPCYMLGLSPALTFQATAAFGPGNTAVVPVSGPLSGLKVGDCFVIDRADPTKVEAVQVSAIDIAGGTVTLGNLAANGGGAIKYAHASGCVLETGLLIEEKRNLPKGRSTVLLTSTPVGRIVGGTGRYGYGRRESSATMSMDQFNLLASLSTFGGPPAWELWPANAAAGIDARTGEVWVPAGIMLAYYSEVVVRYVAGYTYASLPAVIKEATALLVGAVLTSADTGLTKNYQAGDTKITRFTETLMAPDMREQLRPFRARAFA